MTIELPYPPTVNTYWRSWRGRVCISSDGKRYREAVAFGVPRTDPIRGPISVTIDVAPPDRRRRDLDNVCKALLDAMQHAGLYVDDYQIARLHIERRDPDPPDGRVIVSILEIIDG